MKITYRIRSQSDKQVPIYAAMRIPGKSMMEVRTSNNIHPRNWNKEKQRAYPRDPHLKNLNADLEELSSLILRESPSTKEQFKKLILKERSSDIMTFDEVLVNMITESYVSRWTPQTRRNYQVFQRLMIDYGQIGHFKDIDKQSVDAFVAWMLNKRKYTKTYAGRQLTRLKTICREAKSLGIDTHPYCTDFKSFTQPKEERIITTLTEDEVESIISLKCDNIRYENARKWLVIGLHTGFRVNDLLNITEDNIHTDDGLVVIDIVQKKTGNPVSVPILREEVLEIIDDMPNKVTDVEFNRAIKRVCQEAGVHEIIEGDLHDKETKRKKRGFYPKYKLISSHAMRRTFATLHYGKVDTDLLMEITGHSTEKILLHYINKTKDKRDKAKAFAKQLKG